MSKYARSTAPWSTAYLTSVFQVGEGDEGDADAAGLGALLLAFEGLNEEPISTIDVLI